MIINTRADLEALKGSGEYRSALLQLKASMTTRVDAAVYPEGYGQPGYEGEPVATVWQEVETLEAIERLGFSKSEFIALCASAGV